jgi:hypothetical protein
MLAPPAAFAAASTEIHAREPVAGPVLAGEEVVWAQARRDRGFDLLASTAAGRGERIGSFPPARFAGEVLAHLSASSTRVAVAATRFESSGYPYGQDFFTAPVSGSFEALGERCPTPVRDVSRAVDVSGDAVAYRRCSPDEWSTFVVRDFGGPFPGEQRVPGAPAGAVRVAGRYVAALEDQATERLNVSAIVVYDRITGELAYRVPREASSRGIASLALQDDGKVAFSFAPGSGGQQIAWASQTEPFPHVLGLPRRHKYGVQIVDDRIGYIGAQASSGARAEVGVTDLTGASQRIGNNAEEYVFREDFDFDGERIAWWSYGCTTALIHVASVAAAPAPSRPRTGCALRFTRRPRVLAGGRVRLHVDCFGFTAGECSARRVVATARDRRERVVVFRSRRGGGSTLTAAGKRLLARRSRVAVRVRAVLTDSTGRREPRKGRTTLVAQR